MCGHQDAAINPITYGDMDYGLLEKIRAQVGPGITISFHRDGEPTAYRKLREALDLFQGFTTSIVTHGLNLGAKAQDIIGRCTTVTVSVFRGDADTAAQLRSIKEFLSIKGTQQPCLQIKIVGDMLQDGIEEYEALGVRVIRRLIHVPIDNSKYAHRTPAVPECGVCLDALHRPTVDWRGRMYLCNRLDPNESGLIGDLTTSSLDAIWNGETRRRMLDAHKAGRRDLANPLCATCKHWGTPSA
jgi:radical SAM protein with 4Fe4S-binding SPASM domain